ncbi:MAG: lipoprotein-releasing ABC transporter permease subunit [Pseudomonadota bacterium]
MTDQPTPRPFGLFERMLAFRYLRATRRGAGVSLISIIAFAGIMLSVATLIVVMSVMQGFRITLLDQLLGVNGHVFLQPAYGQTFDDDTIIDRLEALDGVKFAVPVLKVQSYAVNGSRGETGVYIQGVRPEDLAKIEEVSGPRSLRLGSLDGFGDGAYGGNGIAVASGVARAIGVNVGDTMTLVTGNGRETPFGRLPTTQKAYRVDAIFTIGNFEYDNIYVYMPLEQAQVFAGKRGEITEIEMRVANAQDIDAYRPAIIDTVGNDFVVLDWRDRFQSFFNALQVERGLLRIILSMIIAIATLNIISSLVMLVKDKNADIAVLKTMGASSGAVLRIFLMVGALIGVTGALVGVVLGTLIASNIAPIEGFLSAYLSIELFPPDVYYLEEIPSVFEAGEVLSVLIFSLSMALLSAAYPSWRASRLDPVEALRYE